MLLPVRPKLKEKKKKLKLLILQNIWYENVEKMNMKEHCVSLMNECLYKVY